MTSPWPKSGRMGLLWGVSQSAAIILANRGGFFPVTQAPHPNDNLSIFGGFAYLGIFGIGAFAGFAQDDPDVTMRAFPLSQLISFLLWWGTVFLIGPVNLGQILGEVELPASEFVTFTTVLLFLVAGVGAGAGYFLMSIHEGKFARSLNWRLVVLAMLIGLVPAALVSISNSITDSSLSHLTIVTGDLALPLMVISIISASGCALYGFIRGGSAPPKLFCAIMLVAALTGIASEVTLSYTYSTYADCVDLLIPCPLADTLGNLTIIMGSSLVTFAIVFLGCLFANDVRIPESRQNPLGNC